MATKSVSVVVCDQCEKVQPKRAGMWVKVTSKDIDIDFCGFHCLAKHFKPGGESEFKTIIRN